MSVAAVRHVNDCLELTWFGNVSRGFEIFTRCVEVERLARIAVAHCFNRDARVLRHGTRPLALVIQEEPETWGRIRFDNGQFNKTIRGSRGRPRAVRVQLFLGHPCARSSDENGRGLGCEYAGRRGKNRKPA